MNTKLTKEEAYKIVYNDLCGIGLFCGTYDAANGQETFMYGIETVMEVIANRAYGEAFSNLYSHAFSKNMLASAKRCKESNN